MTINHQLTLLVELRKCSTCSTVYVVPNTHLSESIERTLDGKRMNKHTLRRPDGPIPGHLRRSIEYVNTECQRCLNCFRTVEPNGQQELFVEDRATQELRRICAVRRPAEKPPTKREIPATPLSHF